VKTPLILFVCTGNICRSPMAAALFQKNASQQGDAEKYRVASAGTWGVDGQPASQHAQTVIRNHGSTLDGHIARTVNTELLQEADLIIVMTRSHRDALTAEFSGIRGKIHLISEFNDLEYDISDPYGKSLDAYQACAADLEQLIQQGYARVPIWLEGKPHRAR
jgi:protein-tyrosine-phosphatase